jgi:hypothetical protein
MKVYKTVKLGVLCTLMSAISCTETSVDDSLVIVEAESWSESIASSSCPYDDYAAFTGQRNFNDGSWTVAKDDFRYGEVLRISWSSSDYMEVRIYGDEGWRGAMDKGRKIDLSDNSSKIAVYFHTRDYNDMLAKGGTVYLIPNSDGTLEVDWCDLVFSKYYYEPEIYLTGSGGVSFRP